VTKHRRIIKFLNYYSFFINSLSCWTRHLSYHPWCHRWHCRYWSCITTYLEIIGYYPSMLNTLLF